MTWPPAQGSGGGGGGGGVTSLNGLTGSLNLSTPNSTLNIGTSGSNVTLDLNLAHANTWTALQTYLAPAVGSGPILLITPTAQAPFNITGIQQGLQLLGNPATSTNTSFPSPRLDLFGQYWTGTATQIRGVSIVYNASTGINAEYLGFNWYDGTTETDAIRIDNPKNTVSPAIWPGGSSGNVYDLGKGTQKFRNLWLAGIANVGQLQTNAIGNANDQAPQGQWILSRGGDSSGQNKIISAANGTIAPPIVLMTQSTTASGIGNSTIRLTIQGGAAQGAAPIFFSESIIFNTNTTLYANFNTNAIIGADANAGNLILNAPTGMAVRIQNNGRDQVYIGASMQLLTGLQYNVASITASTTLTTSNQVVLASASAGAVTVTLPFAANVGLVIIVIKTDSSANAVTISPASGDTIQGATSKTLSAQYSKITLMADGLSTWYDLTANLI